MSKKVLMLLAMTGLLWACTNSAKESEATQEKTEEAEYKAADVPSHFKQNGLYMYPFTESQKFPQAALTLNSPAEGQNYTDGKVAFDFDVEGYELGVQSPEAGSNGLANSAKGQHIHLIIDNDPYSAHYESDFEKEMTEGNHVAIAFLSRSFHESVKNPEAFQVFQFSVGNTGSEPIDMSAPMLFYSRPKGEYSGEGAQKVLFDFYLHNADLGLDGNKVIATFNDETEFIIDKWQPYVVEGLPMGENSVNLLLIDKDGNLVDSPMNNVTRVFTLKP